ncbi:MAG TPA: VOC family protein [Candidatus Egerieimonas intestinavium]|uniref:VOC family protein n=1 Tax=Candidatus Egerieimonas intestinavium TaxID=2840777 RepID=A0A9D1JG60_9FIRM|nr:VOC family protein [Candidatus Egerieimonas intestinavium]
MKLKNILIAVRDTEKSAAFYRELFGLQVILDGGKNVILTEGLVLQERALWEETLKAPVIPKNHAAELYFEEPDIEAFARRLEAYPEPLQLATPLTELPWGKKLLRFYDPDGNLIEVGTPQEAAQEGGAYGY